MNFQYIHGCPAVSYNHPRQTPIPGLLLSRFHLLHFLNNQLAMLRHQILAGSHPKTHYMYGLLSYNMMRPNSDP